MLGNLKAEMARAGIRVKDISQFLGVRYGTAVDKINGRYPFTFNEALKIKREFFPEFNIEYLFDSDNQ